jgi:polysaccharide pyruvyl transferase WcaK-like protein
MATIRDNPAESNRQGTKSILLLNDTSDQQNWGCQATSAALKQELRHTLGDLNLSSLYLRTLREEFTEVEFRLIRKKFCYVKFTGNHGDRTPRLQRLNKALGKPLRKALFDSHDIEFFPAIADQFDDYAEAWLNLGGGPPAKEFLARVSSADAVVFNGEGSILQRTKQGIRPLFLLYLAKKYLNKPSFIINHTAHLETSVPVFLAIARLVYPLMDYVSVREPASRANLIETGVLDAVDVVPDALFSLEFPAADSGFALRASLGLTDKPYVCLNGSSLSYEGLPWKASESYRQMKERFEQLGFTVVFVAKDASDQFLQEIAAETKAAFFGPSHSYHDLYHLLAKSRLFVSGRYHPIIISAMAGCPFLPLTANTHKIEGVCELLEYPVRRPFEYFDLRREMDALIQTAKKLLDNHSTLALQLAAATARLKAESCRNAQRIKQLAWQPPTQRRCA